MKRPVDDTAEAGGEGAGSAAPPAKDAPGRRRLRPAQCRPYLKRQLAERFEKIAEGFIGSAESGSCAHVRLALEVLDTSRRGQAKDGPVEMNSAQRTLQELEELKRLGKMENL